MGTMDELISTAVVMQMRAALRAIAPTAELSNLERAENTVQGARLRQRVDIVRDALLDDLPGGFRNAETIVADLLAEPRFAGWMIWPTTEFVVARALESGSAADFDSAMALLARLTTGLTGEFAIRDLLIARPERALGIMRTWTTDDDEHVRRLASEGSRAYLPWAKRVPWLLDNPRATSGIVDALHHDPSEYVRRSVANHLNDLSRVDASIAIEIASRWVADPDEDTPRAVRHALRTLVKRGDPHALALLGFTGEDLRVTQPHLSRQTVPWGEDIEITAEVTNMGASEAIVAIDYSIGFQRANGSVRPKTFKMVTRRIAAGGTVVVTKTHSFRAITTRTYHPGAHYTTVQANGVASVASQFTLGRQAEH